MKSLFEPRISWLVAVCIFLTAGLAFDRWHPGWIVFLVVFVYNSLVKTSLK